MSIQEAAEWWDAHLAKEPPKLLYIARATFTAAPPRPEAPPNFQHLNEKHRTYLQKVLNILRYDGRDK